MPVIALLAVMSAVAYAQTSAAPNGDKTGPAAKNEPPKLTNAQKRDAILAVKDFAKAATKEKRQEAFKVLMDLGPAGAEMIAPVVDDSLSAASKQYIQIMASKIRQAYIKRLISLTDEQVLQVQKMRRLWKDYASHGGSRHDFQKQYLKPAWDVAAFLLVKPAEVTDPNIAAPRSAVIEMLDYQTQCRTALGIDPDPDPTKGKKSPTGVDLPSLDEVPTRMFCLEFLERTLALCAASPEGAHKVLLMDLESAREIDVQETEFTMYTNTVRMLIGTVAWYVDPLVCAATRDHSADRKAGLASAHMSTVPGKHGFTDRLKRMGARFCGSEGAGGGRNGPAYAHGLSYGGGHTGPLYSLRRNIVGVGRRGGVYTSDYGTDGKLLHPCAVTLGELFMPPGTGRADVKNPILQAIYNCLYTGDFGRAHTLLSQARFKDDFDIMLLRFFKAYVTAEVDWFFESVAVIEPTGDIYELKRRMDWAKKAFDGIAAFEEKAEPIFQRLGGKKPDKELAKTFEAGKIYRTIYTKVQDGSINKQTIKGVLDEFMKRYSDSIYTQAANACLEDLAKDAEADINLVGFFRAKGDGDALDKYSYYKD
jgi:hypothetical protein